MNPEQRYLPLLRLSRKAVAARAGKTGGERKFHRPLPSRQGERLTPQFQRLQEALEARRLRLHDQLGGTSPEMALVLETIGSVADFLKAVQKVESLEWLGEVDVELLADEEFYDLKDPRRALGGSIYLVMTDRRALDELLSLWVRWQKAPKERFAQGWNPWRGVFSRLREIRPWSPEDRVRETGLADAWTERLEAGDDQVRTEIELWFRKNPESQRRAQAIVEDQIAQVGGQSLRQTILPEIAYHGVLAEVPAAAAKGILALGEVDLVRCDEVMFFRPVGQLAIPSPDEDPGPDAPAPGAPGAPGEPTIALFDGMPLERHQQLDGRLLVDDPDEWAAQIPAAKRHHGTSMASLILHGDLSSMEAPLKRPIYVRPVLRPAPWDGSQEELTPTDELAVDLLHRAIRRLFVDDQGGAGAAPSVHIANLSIGDRSRPYDRLVSPLARLVDWLAWEYQLLIVASAGNHPDAVALDRQIAGLSAADLQSALWRALRERAHLQRILSPAEAINVLTVGAEHRDACGPFDLRHRLDPAIAAPGETVPSPLNGWGPGPGRAIKPEVLVPGGRLLYTEDPGRRLRPAWATATPPGQRVAATGQAASLAQTRYTTGTSNAAALTSRAAGQLLDMLPTLIDGFDPDIERRFVAPMLKALFVHGASWGETQELCGRLLSSSDRNDLGRFLGFGFADITRVLGCTEQRVTLVAWAQISKEEADLYTLPLPSGLSGIRGKRRFVTTLAWLTPINPVDRRYRKADLWVSVGSDDDGPKGKLGVSRCEADHRAAMRGTVQHEIWEGQKATAFGETEELSLQVNCREHAQGLEQPIPYALLVTLEVAPELGVQVYQEVRARIAPRVRVEG
jgi:hypothetical protein